MISTVTPFKDSTTLEQIINRDPSMVDVVGTLLPDRVPYSGTLVKLQYGNTIVTKHNNTLYSISKRPDNTFIVHKDK